MAAIKRWLIFLVTFLLISISFLGCQSQSSIESPKNRPESKPAQNQPITSPSSEKTGLNPSSAPVRQTPEFTVKGKLRVHFIDVGQGDSILIQTPDGRNVLIDAGPGSAGSTVERYLASLGVRNIDVVIGTHPHEDHIGGMDGVINDFGIGKIYLPKAAHTTRTYADLLETIKNKGLRVTTARGGVKLDLGSGIKAEFLAPNGSSYNDLNNYSAVLELAYGRNSFLFAGDAGDLSESQMLAGSYDLDVDVLKVGHHGSRSSSSAAFLKFITPKYAVISVGAGNRYGHPSAETVSALAKAGAKVYRTDEDGTIIIESDGTTLKEDDYAKRNNR